MALFKIKWKKSAYKELRNVPRESLLQIIKRVENLGSNPLPVGNKKLSGSEKTYRLKVGVYRIVYEIEKKRSTILIIRIRHRKDVYK